MGNKIEKLKSPEIGKAALKFVKNQMILCLLILFIIVLAIIRPSFVSLHNIKNVLIDASIYGVAALAMTMAIITGAFDLSMSANFAWGQIFFCFLLNNWGDTPIGILGAFLCAIVSCMLIGMLNGVIIVKTGISAWICTMSMNYIIKGWCLVFTDSDMIKTENPFIVAFGKGTFLGISYLTYIFIALAVLVYVIMKFTKYGRNLYATGGNAVAAKLAGINTDFHRFTTFGITGLAAGIAGCMYVCLIRAGSVLYGTDLALTCVAATVVGGTPLSGGRGGVHRTVIGILLIYIMYKGLGFLGLAGYVNTMVRGIVLLAVVGFDAFMTQSGTKRVK